MRQTIRELVSDILPFDDVESQHQANVLAWLDSGEQIFRTAKPATPAKHLVSYCLLVDSETDHALLVDHRDAQRWLPTGGHVEPNEHPAVAAQREIAEELQIKPPFHSSIGEVPVFVTVTDTGGLCESHTDVSLWFVFEGSVWDELSPDDREFADARWWPFDDIAPGLSTRFDPHLPRLVKKLRSNGL